MNLFYVSCMLVAVSCLSACSMRMPPPDDFSFRPDSLKTYNIHLVRQTQDDGTQNGKPYSIVWREKAGMTLRFISQEDTLYHLKLCFTKYKRERPDSGQAIEQDTVAYEPAPTAAQVKNDANMEIRYWYSLAMGVTVDVWMNKKGEVARVDGYNRIVDSVVARCAGDRRTIAYVLRNGLGEEAVRDYLTCVFPFVPARRMETGKSWVVDQTLTSMAPILLSNIYVLNRRSGDTAWLNVTTYLSARRSEQGLTYMKGKQTGTITASYSTGIPYKYRAEGETTIQTDKYYRLTRRSIYAVVR